MKEKPWKYIKKLKSYAIATINLGQNVTSLHLDDASHIRPVTINSIECSYLSTRNRPN